jgi:hypothetical protein
VSHVRTTKVNHHHLVRALFAFSLSARLLAFIRRDDSSTNKQTNKQTNNSRLFSHLRQEKDDSPKNQQKKKKNADTQKANQAERSLKLFAFPSSSCGWHTLNITEECWLLEDVLCV